MYFACHSSINLIIHLKKKQILCTFWRPMVLLETLGMLPGAKGFHQTAHHIPARVPAQRSFPPAYAALGCQCYSRDRHLFLDLLQEMRTSSRGARRAPNLSLPPLTSPCHSTSSHLCADLAGGSLSRAQSSSPSTTSGLSCTQSGLLVKGCEAHALWAAWGLRPRERRQQVLS